MASYLEIKQTLKEIFRIETEIDEECDIVFEGNTYTEEPFLMTLSNEELRTSFDRIQNYNRDKLQMCTATSREAAISSMHFVEHMEPITDTVNNITYSMGPATIDYCLFLLDGITEYAKLNGRRIISELRMRGRMVGRQWVRGHVDNASDILPTVLRAYTIKVESDKPVSSIRLKECASSLEFLIMYRKSVPVSEWLDIGDMYSVSNFGMHHIPEKIDSPPQRIYNSAVLDYYTMAMEARDPFTMYISFYHIVEHYFDAVFRKKLTDEIKNKITQPDFSYKSEDNLYALAKYIRKHMSSDDDSGKGNEFESLKYVLMEYVPIEELRARIKRFDSHAITYYQNNSVPFTNSKKTKISWTDSQGVYTNLATRIYETRNALVHSKSEQSANQYRPYEDRKELGDEIALIRAVAETTLINSSEIL